MEGRGMSTSRNSTSWSAETLPVDSTLLPTWTLALVLFVSYLAFEWRVTKNIARKQGQHPLVGGIANASLIPRFILNWNFATKAAGIIEQGYQKFKTSSYQIIRHDGSVVVLPLTLLDELASLPAAVASPHGALEHDLLGHYTGLNLILDSRLHHSIIQRKLTPRLGALTPLLQTELKSAFDDHFPACDGSDWTEFRPYQTFDKLSARVSARALVGPALCRDATWLDISINYTENLFRTIVVLRLFPSWLHPFLCYLLPSYWRGQSYVKSAKALLGPKLLDLIRRNNDGSWTPDSSEEDSNVLAWLANAAKGSDRDPDKLAHVEVLLALASVHTTLLRMVNVLYDLTANPDCLEELRAEIRTEVVASQDGWSSASFSKLPKLDSVLRESQRMSPPTILGMKRLFKQAHTFANGLHLPKGTYVCLPTFAIENDPAHTANPESFDGLRTYRKRLQDVDSSSSSSSSGSGAAASTSSRSGADERFLFSAIDRTALNFGYGKSACPGRFFAALVIKILFVKLLSEYEFRFLPGQRRPKNILVHEFLFCWPWQKMLVRRRRTPDARCPF